jgi:hypothetical protein
MQTLETSNGFWLIGSEYRLVITSWDSPPTQVPYGVPLPGHLCVLMLVHVLPRMQGVTLSLQNATCHSSCRVDALQLYLVLRYETSFFVSHLVC